MEPRIVLWDVWRFVSCNTARVANIAAFRESLSKFITRRGNAPDIGEQGASTWRACPHGRTSLSGAPPFEDIPSGLATGVES